MDDEAVSDESTLTAESEDADNSDSSVIISEEELEEETDRPQTLYVITVPEVCLSLLQ